jgi:hypothetical protein
MLHSIRQQIEEEPHIVPRALRIGALDMLINPVNGRLSSNIRNIADAADEANSKSDLLQIEWVKWGGFSQVECDSKGFFVNVTVTSSRHVCAHAKIDQDEAPER